MKGDVEMKKIFDFTIAFVGFNVLCFLLFGFIFFFCCFAFGASFDYELFRFLVGMSIIFGVPLGIFAGFLHCNKMLFTFQ